MITKSVYQIDSGHIIGTVSGPEDIIDNTLVVGQASIYGIYDGEVYYVKEDVVIERSAQTTALSGFTLTGLPVPSTLWIDSTAYAVTDSTVTLDLPLPGTYPLRVEAWPYIDWTGSVTV